jgi:hypothetical protein
MRWRYLFRLGIGLYFDKYFRLRIACSIACAAAILPLIWLWARTADVCEGTWGPLTSNVNLTVMSRQGGIGIRIQSGASGRWSYHAYPPDTVPQIDYKTALGFSIALHPLDAGGPCFRVKYLNLILLAIGMATLPWLRWRFSLRAMLIATALVAVVLGWIVWLSR